MAKYLAQMTTTPATVNTGVPSPALAPTSAALIGSGGWEIITGFGALEDEDEVEVVNGRELPVAELAGSLAFGWSWSWWWLGCELTRVAGRGSRVAGRRSRVAGRGSRVAGRGSRVAGRG